MICPICTQKMVPVFTAQVLGKYDAHFDHCRQCGYLRIANPHWLDEAYSSAIAATDTGLVMRNIAIARKLAVLLYFVLPGHGAGRYLDEAGGYGLLTRLMRDYGFDFYWSDKYCSNLLARGFSASADKAPFAAVTAFEAIEHVPDPAAFVAETLRFSGSETFIFTTELYDGVPPRPDQWWYYSLATGQHISFFQRKTLERMASNLGLNYHYVSGLHIYSKSELSKFRRKLLSKKIMPLMMKILSRRVKGKHLEDYAHLMAQVPLPNTGER